MMTLDTRRCWQEGKCFARCGTQCSILTETWRGKCSFQKEKRNYTNGVYYPFNPAYQKMELEENKTVGKKDILEKIKRWERQGKHL